MVLWIKYTARAYEFHVSLIEIKIFIVLSQGSLEYFRKFLSDFGRLIQIQIGLKVLKFNSEILKLNPSLVIGSDNLQPLEDWLRNRLFLSLKCF